MSNGYKEYASNDVATTSVSGLMSAIDKLKLDGIEAQANNYVHPDTHPASMIEGLADYMATLGYGKCASGSYVGDGTGTLNIKHKETIAGVATVVRTQFRNDARKIDMGFTPAFVIMYHKHAKSQLWLFKFDLSSNNSEILTDNGIGYMKNEIYLANSFKDYNGTNSVVAEGTYDSNKGFNISGYKYYWIAFA